MAEMSLKREPLDTMVSNCTLPRSLLDPWDGICSVGPSLPDQFFDRRVPCFLKRPDLDVARSLPDALEHVMLVVEPRSEQESNCHIRLHRRDVADTASRRIVKRVADGVIVKELVRSVHRASRQVAQLFDYCPYFFRIVRNKHFNGIRRR